MPSYQWQKDYIDIPDATCSTYTISVVTAEHTGSYRCVITNAAGTRYSKSAELEVVSQDVNITSQPQGNALYYGNNYTLSVTATGTNLAYQWQKDSQDIPGANSSTYTLISVSIADEGTYRCIVSNSTSSETSSDALITVFQQPVSITVQPQDDSIYVGDTATFSVTATGSSLEYQWQKNSVNISGATSSSYTTPVVSISDDGNVYKCVVSNPVSSVESDGATLSVTDVPVSITGQPQSDSIYVGDTASFSVTATGTNLTYQWQKNDVNIGGATSSSYTTPVVSLSDDGDIYKCVVSNASGSVESDGATLSVTDVPVSITGNPEGQMKYYGQDITFSVTATGTNLQYQWQKDTVNIGGATSSSYALLSVDFDDAASYRCVVSNSNNSQTSNSATLTVIDEPVSINTHPQSQSKDLGQGVTFSVSATGTNLVYQWKKNAGDIGGATSSSYIISSVLLSDDGDQYSCVVSNSNNSQTSNTATLTVVDVSFESLGFKDPPNGPTNSNDVRYSPNTSGDRTSLTHDILPNMKLYLDMTSSDMPYYYEPITNNKVYLTEQQVQDGVELAMRCWESVLPQFRFQFESDIAQANFRVKFRSSHSESPSGATGYSMLPTQVVSNPDLVGDKQENTIYVVNENMATSVVDYISSKQHYEFYSSIRNRSNPNEVFHFLNMQYPDYLPEGVSYPFTVNIQYGGAYGDALLPTEWTDATTKRVCIDGTWTAPIVWTNPGTPVDLTNPYYDKSSTPYAYLAVTGGGNGEGDYPRLTEQYFTPDILDDASHYSTFGYWGFIDLVYLMEHEFAHTLLGGHDVDILTGAINTKKYVEPLEEDIMNINNAICKMDSSAPFKIDEITDPSTFSCLWYGWAPIGLWNMRGIFDRDADRLAAASSDLDWTGYSRVSYPVTDYRIKLQKSDSSTFYTDNWHTAQELMGWPKHSDSSNLAAHDTQWFLTGVIPPSVGDTYLSNATDNDWTANYIYQYNGTSWDATTPSSGDVANIDSTYYMYNGSSWAQL